MKIMRLIAALVLCVAATACGDDGRFSVEGNVADGRSMNLRYVFYNGDSFMQGITAVRDGRFRFEGTAPQPVMIELYDNDYRLLGRLYAGKGDEIRCTIDPAGPNRINATGRKDLERWTRWLRDNADALAAGGADSLVCEYVHRNPEDVVSTLLVCTQLDASTDKGMHRCDSLLGVIAPEARPFNITQSLVAQTVENIGGSEARVHDFVARIYNKGNDTLRISSSPLWLISVCTESSNRRDSVLPLLLHTDSSYSHSRLRVLDLSLDMDTSSWRRVIRPDSAAWTQAWLPGGTAARGLDSLAITRLPYFIVADSTGRQLLRSASAAGTRAFLHKYFEQTAYDNN